MVARAKWISTDPTIKEREREKTFSDQIRDLTDLSDLISPAKNTLFPWKPLDFRANFLKEAGVKAYLNSDAEQTSVPWCSLLTPWMHTAQVN